MLARDDDAGRVAAFYSALVAEQTGGHGAAFAELFGLIQRFRQCGAIVHATILVKCGRSASGRWCKEFGGNKCDPAKAPTGSSTMRMRPPIRASSRALERDAHV